MAVYRAEFVVVETPSEQPHKELADTSKPGANPSALAGNGATLGSVAKKILPKLSVAAVVSLGIKTADFIVNTVQSHNSNSALISGDTVAYKHLQNQQAVWNKSFSIASKIARGATAGAIAGSVVPGLGTAVGAGIGTAVAAVSAGIQQLMHIPEYEEQKRLFNAKEQTDRIVNNLDRERFGTNAKTFR